MRLARSLGISLRRFQGWRPDAGPEFDDWERALWRCFDDWERDRCPDCGQSLHESLWREDTPETHRPRWKVTTDWCMSCRELETAQLRASTIDQKRARALPPDQPPPPTRYRKWRVTRDTNPDDEE